MQEPDYKLDEMVNRFLTWPLPDSVCPDKATTDPNRNSGKYRPLTGTNLLNAKEAEAMLTHVLSAPSPPAQDSPTEAVAGLYFAHDGDNNEFFDSLDKAKAAAKDAIEFYQGEAPEGWNDNSLNVCYGMVLGKVEITEDRPVEPEDTCDPLCSIFESRELIHYTHPAATPMADLAESYRKGWEAGHADATKDATPNAEAGDRFFVEHGVVHDRLTGKHLGPNHPDCSAEELLDVLKHLQNDACAWRMTAKAFDTPSKSEVNDASFYRNELDSLVRSICSTPYFPDDWACMDCVIRARAALSQPKPTHRELRTAEEIQPNADAGALTHPPQGER